MAKIGHYNELEVIAKMDFGLYLDSDGVEILLPKNEIPPHTRVGDKLNVFVFTNSDGRPVATTLKPKAVLEEFVCLKVKEVTDFGAFLDWGIDKDLFVPFKEQKQKMAVGEKYVVRVCMDHQTNRVYAASRLEKYLRADTSKLEVDQKVRIMIYSISDLGYRLIVENKYPGMLFKNEVFENLDVGDIREGYIKKIRDDGKLDISLQKKGYLAIMDSREIVLNILKEKGGFLPFHDKSDPEDIKQTFRISKKTFKKIIGNLYKEGFITISEDGITLIKK